MTGSHEKPSTNHNKLLNLFIGAIALFAIGDVAGKFLSHHLETKL